MAGQTNALGVQFRSACGRLINTRIPYSVLILLFFINTRPPAALHDAPDQAPPQGITRTLQGPRRHPGNVLRFRAHRRLQTSDQRHRSHTTSPQRPCTGESHPRSGRPVLENPISSPPFPTGGGRGRLPLRGRARRGPPQHLRPTARRPPTRGRAAKRIGKILPAVDVLQPPEHPLRKRGVRRVGRGGVRCHRVSSGR